MCIVYRKAFSQLFCSLIKKIGLGAQDECKHNLMTGVSDWTTPMYCRRESRQLNFPPFYGSRNLMPEYIILSRKQNPELLP